MSKYGVFSGPYFPVFGLTTDIYSVNLLDSYLITSAQNAKKPIQIAHQGSYPFYKRLLEQNFGNIFSRGMFYITSNHRNLLWRKKSNGYNSQSFKFKNKYSQLSLKRVHLKYQRRSVANAFKAKSKSRRFSV